MATSAFQAMRGTAEIKNMLVLDFLNTRRRRLVLATVRSSADHLTALSLTPNSRDLGPFSH